MVYISLYLVTAIVFLMLDVMMLKKVLYPLFSSNIGAIMNEDPKMGPAAVFYLFYVGGIIWFASLPALASGQPSQAFLRVSSLGFWLMEHMSSRILQHFAGGLLKWLPLM